MSEEKIDGNIHVHSASGVIVALVTIGHNVVGNHSMQILKHIGVVFHFTEDN